MTLDKDQSSPQATVLIVTDDNKDVDSLARFLVCHDMIVLRAYHVPECLEIVRSHTVDAVLLDVKMPGMDAPRLGEELKQVSPRRVVVFVNGDDWKTRMARAGKAVPLFINLPADPSVKISDHARLLTRIQGLIGGYRSLKQEADQDLAAIEPAKPPAANS